jgi:hypothetical protein
MAYGFPLEIVKRIGAQAVIAANRRVARRFVPAYASTMAIRLVPPAPRRTLARQVFARLKKAPRRLVS